MEKLTPFHPVSLGIEVVYKGIVKRFIYFYFAFLVMARRYFSKLALALGIVAALSFGCPLKGNEVSIDAKAKSDSNNSVETKTEPKVTDSFSIKYSEETDDYVMDGDCPGSVKNFHFEDEDTVISFFETMNAITGGGTFVREKQGSSQCRYINEPSNLPINPKNRRGMCEVMGYTDSDSNGVLSAREVASLRAEVCRDRGIPSYNR